MTGVKQILLKPLLLLIKTTYLVFHQFFLKKLKYSHTTAYLSDNFSLQFLVAILLTRGAPYVDQDRPVGRSIGRSWIIKKK